MQFNTIGKWALLFVTFVQLCPTGEGNSHCLSHDHCGDNAVCVTDASTAAPVCRCLVGYKGDGDVCVDNSGNLAEQAAAILKAKQRTVVIEKCGSQTRSISGGAGSTAAAAAAAETQQRAAGSRTAASGVPDPSPPLLPSQLRPASPKRTQPRANEESRKKSTESTSASGTANEGSKVNSKFPDRKLATTCSAVECDFKNGPCAYQNDYYSEWQLREIEGGTILLSTGDSKTEHYLLSGTMVIAEPSLLLFDYFESSFARSHLSVYSNDLATLVWKSNGKEPGWQQAVATLKPGQHQIIIASEKLNAQELVAVTNIRLVNASGSTASCYL